MRVVAIIQARMGSSRLPGKVLREVAGQPMLVHVLERALACKHLDQVIVATTDTAEDTAVFEVAETFGVATFTGSRDDVLDRYYRAAQAYNADVVVRLTADCPLLDPAEVDCVIRYFLAHLDLDYAGTGRTYPQGYDAEVFSIAALRRAWQGASLRSEREHVTPYIWKHPELFRVERLELQEDLSTFRVTVDEEPDLQVVSSVVEALAPSDPLFGMNVTVAFLRAHPEIASMNTHIGRLEGYWMSVAADKHVPSQSGHPEE